MGLFGPKSALQFTQSEFAVSKIGPFANFGKRGLEMEHWSQVRLQFGPKVRPQTNPSQKGHLAPCVPFWAIFGLLGFWLGWRRGFSGFRKFTGPTGFFRWGQIPSIPKAKLVKPVFGWVKMGPPKIGGLGFCYPGSFWFWPKGPF